MVYSGDSLEGIKQRWSVFKAVPTIVDEKFEAGMKLAVDALQTASETIASLKEVSGQLNDIDTNIILPNLTSPDLGTFTATLPIAPSINANFPSAPSNSEEIQIAIHDKLIHDLQTGSPAIPEDVEDAIFKKDFERSELILQDTIDRLSAEWSQRGFILPNGMLAANISQAVIEYGNKRTDTSRDIAIKNFELSDSNMKFAIQQGLAFLLNKITVYKAEIDAEIARIDSLVRMYLGETEVYKGTANVYATLAGINIEKFKAELGYETTRAELLMKQADIDIKNFEVINGLKMEAMKNIGAMVSQEIAGAFSSVSASVSMSAGNAADYKYDAPASLDEVVGNLA